MSAITRHRRRLRRYWHMLCHETVDRIAQKLDGGYSVHVRRKMLKPRDARLVVDISSVSALALCHLDQGWNGCLSTAYFLPRGSDLQYRFRDAELVDLYHHVPCQLWDLRAASAAYDRSGTGA